MMMYNIGETVKVVGPQVDFNLEVKIIAIKENKFLVEWNDGPLRYSENIKEMFGLDETHKDMKFLILLESQIKKVV
jgi:hypothetical protein